MAIAVPTENPPVADAASVDVPEPPRFLPRHLEMAALLRRRGWTPLTLMLAQTPRKTPAVRLVDAPSQFVRPVAAARESHARPSSTRRKRSGTSPGRSSSADDDPPPARPVAPSADRGRFFEVHPLGYWRPLNGHRWPGSRIYREILIDRVEPAAFARPAQPVRRRCECGCGKQLPGAKTKPRRYFSDACRKRAARQTVRAAA